MQTAQQKLQTLLQSLFRADAADLDFGIYRIINFRRKEFETFINDELPKRVNTALDANADIESARQELDELAAKVRQNLGDDVLDADGNLVNDTYANAPIVKEYLAAKTEHGSPKSRAQREEAVFNHLYTFFSRYYESGDFIPRRRYAQTERYAIPYNGEEIYLHWANREQYYVKSGDKFSAYQFNAQGINIAFELRDIDVEKDNVKGTKRFFIPIADEVTGTDSEVRIPFEFRPLTDDEKERFRGQKVQDKINDAAEEDIIARVSSNFHALAALEQRIDDVTTLKKHLRAYTRGNSADFFIHKDLGGFLTRELDFYLKNEVVQLNSLIGTVVRARQSPNENKPSAAGDQAIATYGLSQTTETVVRDRLIPNRGKPSAGFSTSQTISGGGQTEWLETARTVHTLASDIIAFLAHIEEFQKRLWLKKKFVLSTHYCITLDRVPTEFYPEIAANTEQRNAWKSLFSIHEINSNLIGADYAEPLTVEFLTQHPNLVLDTGYFSADFKNRLLSHFDNLDAETDGVLIHSENFQALNLLTEKYRESLKAIYIDPPYNTDASAILYKNNYKDSSWMSLMIDRLELSYQILPENGIICVAIDDVEVSPLRLILASLFEQELGIATVRSNPQGRASKGYFSPAHEYALFYGKSEASPGSLPKTEKQKAAFPHQDEKGRYLWDNLIRRPPKDNRSDRPRLYYPIYAQKDNTIRIPKLVWNEEKRTYDNPEPPREDETVVWPIKDGQEKHWRRGWETVSSEIDDYRVRREENIRIDFKLRMKEVTPPKTWWAEGTYAAARYGTKLLESMLGKNDFDFPKSPYLVADCLRATSLLENGTVLDYFGGSGTTAHAAINLNRQDGGKRKYILVEMGHHFDTVLKPRVLKAIYAEKWQDGKPVSRESRLSQIIKYQRIESYEDALNNIEFAETDDAPTFLNEHRLSYMLDRETRESPTFLNVKELERPFSYHLKIVNGLTVERSEVDLPETFNYLLGMSVQTRRCLRDESDRTKVTDYLIYRGIVAGKAVVIIWRETAGWGASDYERDYRFITEADLTTGADEVYVNTNSVIPDAKVLDGLFKRLMFDTSSPS